MAPGWTSITLTMQPSHIADRADRHPVARDRHRSSTRRRRLGPSRVPAGDRGVAWSDQVLEAPLGYPYFLQAIGKHVWDNAVRHPISADHVHVGIRERLAG